MGNQPGGNTSDTARLMLGAPEFAVGWQERILVPQPAAGAQWKYTADGRFFERVIAIAFTFATSAVVATRFPLVQLVDNNNVVVTGVTAGNAVVASSIVNPNLWVGAPQLATGASGGTFGYMPDILIPPGWSWQSNTFAMDAGDQFSGIVVLTQRYPNDAAMISAVG